MTRTELALTALHFYNAEVFEIWTWDVYEAEQKIDETNEIPEDWAETFYRAWEQVEELPELVYDLLEELYTDNIHELSKNLWDFNEMVKGR